MNHLRIILALLSLLFPTAIALGQEGCAADADGDGVVNGNDLAIVLGSWGPCVGCPGDLNANGLVNGEDLAVALTRWGSTCAPTVSSMSATAGPLAGGTAVTITGAHLLNPTSVTFGGTPAAVALSSKDSLTVVAPSRSEGPATVIVSTAGGSVSAGVFTYYGAPTITSVSPNTAPSGGGTAVSITGSGFFGGVSVSFGGSVASTVSVQSPTQITAVAPPGSVGSTVAISVSTASGTSTLPNALSYVSITVPSWAALLESEPDPAVVTDSSLRTAISATGYAWRVRDKATGIEMVLIPAGSFNMGCSASMQFPCYDGELPIHQVSISSAYYMGRYEVKQEEWARVMGTNPSHFQGDGYQNSSVRPVERVSWPMALEFVAQTNLRLPSEAEWEFACRAGTQKAFHGSSAVPAGTDDDSLVVTMAWYGPNSGGETHPVGLKLANGFGLHDMMGNVWEWVNDWFSYTYYAESPSLDPTGPGGGGTRVLRGGSWDRPETYMLRCSYRLNPSPGIAYNYLGFRVARNP
jgi:formylglycine-generating enzyme required for sulfatase activity